MLAIFWLLPGRASDGLTMDGSPPPNKSKILAIMLRFVVDDVTAKLVETEVVRGIKAAAEEAAAMTPSRTGREEENLIVCFCLCSIAKLCDISMMLTKGDFHKQFIYLVERNDSFNR